MDLRVCFSPVIVQQANTNKVPFPNRLVPGGWLHGLIGGSLSLSLSTGLEKLKGIS